MNEKDFLQEQQVFCKNILLLRKKHRLSKKEMAQLLGIGISTLGKIEKGELPPRLSASIVFRVYEHFHVSTFAELGK